MHKYWNLKYKEIVEDSRRLQLSEYNKGIRQIEKGKEKSPFLMSCNGHFGGVYSGPIRLDYDMENKQCILAYKLGARRLEYPIDVIKKETHNKGFRYYWLCPHCKRPIRTLYKAVNNDLFLCRKCSNLIYWAQKKHNKTEDKLIKMYGRNFC